MGAYNIKFPIIDNNITNTFFELNRVTKDAYTSDLMLLLLTQKGERYYDSDYGTNLEKYLFEPNDDTTATDILEEIKRTVSKYMPNITIKSVTFSRSDTDNSLSDDQIVVNISFVYMDDTFSEPDTLTLKF